MSVPTDPWLIAYFPKKLKSRNAYTVLVGKPEGKITLGRPRRRWEVNIKVDLKEVGCDAWPR